MTLIRNLALGAAITLAAAAPAQAHRMWILPSSFTLSGDEQLITVDGAISNDLFFPNHVAMSLDNVAITAPDGTVTAVEDGWTGDIRSTFDVTLDQQGTWKIGQGGATYFARWTEDGEDKRSRGSLESFEADGILAKDDVSLTKSARNAATYVTLGAPTDTVFAPTGEGLEFVPVTHPNDLYTGDEITFSFLLDGEPAAGLEVDIVKGDDRYRDTPGLLELTADEEGMITFTIEEAGRYWMATSIRGETTIAGKPGEMSNSIYVTLEVLPL